MEESEWTMIYRTSNPNEAEILRGLLADNDIGAVIMNKKDSSYLFGELELFVPTEHAFEATQIIKNTIE